MSCFRWRNMYVVGTYVSETKNTQEKEEFSFSRDHNYCHILFLSVILSKGRKERHSRQKEDTSREKNTNS